MLHSTQRRLGSVRGLPKSISLYRKRLRYLPKYKVGAIKRETQSFTCDPTILKSAKDKAGRLKSFSAIIEALLDGWVKGLYVIPAAEPTPTPVVSP